jgi:cation:H+ antiporter
MVSLVRQQVSAEETAALTQEVQERLPNEKVPNLWFCIALVVLGGVLLAAGAHFTVEGAVGLARLLGMSERVIGLTIVSIGTSLPEVVASVVSSIRGRSDMAVGNVIGSNLFNTLIILGVSGLIAPLPVQADIIASDCWWMLGITLLLFPLMFFGRRLKRWEGFVLLAVYIAYLSVLLNTAAPAPAAG